MRLVQTMNDDLLFYVLESTLAFLQGGEVPLGETSLLCCHMHTHDVKNAATDGYLHHWIHVFVSFITLTHAQTIYQALLPQRAWVC